MATYSDTVKAAPRRWTRLGIATATLVVAVVAGVGAWQLAHAGSTKPAVSVGQPLAAGAAPVTVLGFERLGSSRQAQPAQAQAVDRVAVVLRAFDAAAQGDLDTALAQFADNAVFIGSRPTGNCSYQTPCTDLTGIRQQLQGSFAIHSCFAIRWIQVSGAVVTGELEIRNDIARGLGVERILQVFIAQVPQDKITFFAGAIDLADPTTALNVANQPAGTPIPAPTTPCPPLLPQS